MNAALPLLAALLAAPPTADRVRELARKVADRGTDVYLRAQAAAELRRLGVEARPAVPTLVLALRDPDSRARAVAAWALGRVGEGDRRAVAGLVRALGDPDRLVWHEATRSLWEVDAAGPRTAAALGALLLDREHDEYEWGPPAKVLLAAVLNGDLNAVTAVRVYPEELLVVREKVRERRLWAASKLAALGPAARPALPALRLAADDGDPVVRRAAAEALKKVGGEGRRP